MVRVKFNYQRTMLIITEQFPDFVPLCRRLPEQPIFMHLPEISKAQTVVICQTMGFISVNFT